ncbi:uncharacterized protein MYCFIDRAFT_176329 [Pseudocercospora fijiensis CIRAD86]|uniref:Uncharacterized protein n=1 Tax=Pseudocercospora fijiensis (strain CIRAD86) TaxID=383855 RepID=M3AU13_PSEFD|nr:uncharacterized protein MYCFIDRAFT_176329 [Pseudocercospora fijiensis CIRAD86]EME80982.1 hypothetical protein MYCFIDRAFT_176329 [Pseudocercospora fijiensis CIRAD86]
MTPRVCSSLHSNRVARRCGEVCSVVACQVASDSNRRRHIVVNNHGLDDQKAFGSSCAELEGATKSSVQWETLRLKAQANTTVSHVGMKQWQAWQNPPKPQFKPSSSQACASASTALIDFWGDPPRLLRGAEYLVMDLVSWLQAQHSTPRAPRHDGNRNKHAREQSASGYVVDRRIMRDVKFLTPVLRLSCAAGLLMKESAAPADAAVASLQRLTPSGGCREKSEVSVWLVALEALDARRRCSYGIIFDN